MLPNAIYYTLETFPLRAVARTTAHTDNTHYLTMAGNRETFEFEQRPAQIVEGADCPV